MKADYLFYLLYKFDDHESNGSYPISWFVEVPFPARPTDTPKTLKISISTLDG